MLATANCTLRKPASSARARARPIASSDVSNPTTSAGATSPAKPQVRDPAPHPKSTSRIPARRCGTTRAASRLMVRRLKCSVANSLPANEYSFSLALVVDVSWVNVFPVPSSPECSHTVRRTRPRVRLLRRPGVRDGRPVPCYSQTLPETRGNAAHERLLHESSELHVIARVVPVLRGAHSSLRPALGG